MKWSSDSVSLEIDEFCALIRIRHGQALERGADDVAQVCEEHSVCKLLVDLRGVEGTLTASAIFRSASTLSSLEKCAIVGSPSRLFNARLYAAVAESQGISSCIFTDDSQAATWLETV